MRIRFFGALILVLFSTLFVSGCSAPSSPISSNQISSLDPSEMALQISDLPDGFRKFSSTSLPELQNQQVIGTVKKGYQVVFIKESGQSEYVKINQIILIVPVEQINQFIPNFISEALKTRSSASQLSNPGIGESSAAFRVQNSQTNDEYAIVFIKQDVVEIIGIDGTQTDYELLKSLAKKV